MFLRFLLVFALQHHLVHSGLILKATVRLEGLPGDSLGLVSGTVSSRSYEVPDRGVTVEELKSESLRLKGSCTFSDFNSSLKWKRMKEGVLSFLNQ